MIYRNQPKYIIPLCIALTLLTVSQAFAQAAGGVNNLIHNVL